MAKSSKPKFRDSVAEYERLRSQIAARRFAPIYLLMGDEGYFIDALSEQLGSTILNEAERAFGQVVVYGKDSEVGAIVNLCRQMPMMGQYQVVIVREAQQLRQIDQLSLYTSAPSPTTILIICHKEKTIDKRTSLYKHCAAVGEVFESVRPRDYEIGSWLTDFVRSKSGCTIEQKALAMMTDHLGTDIAKISNELSKLMLSLPEGTRAITASHIEQNIGISKDFNNFELMKAITSRNLSRAMLIADHFARNPKENPLVVTLMAMFREFRQLFTINYLNWQQRTKGIPMPSDQELCRMLGVPAPFLLAEIKQTAARWPNNRVFNILGIIREYDAKCKGIGTGGLNEGELLREMILKILV